MLTHGPHTLFGTSSFQHTTALTRLSVLARWVMVENGSVVFLGWRANQLVLSTPSVRFHVVSAEDLISDHIFTGINYESSFEAGLLENTNYCEVWGYDFSVKSFGPEIPKHLRSRTHFEQYALGGGDRFSDDNSHPLYTLDTIMNMNKHKHIDILKIDIESWEFETLTTLVDQYIKSGKPLPFGQLQLEVHIWHKRFAEFLEWWEKLEEAGLRPFWTEPNIVYQNYNEHVDLAEVCSF